MIFIWIPKTGGTTFTKVLHPEITVMTEDYHKFSDHGLPTSVNMSFGHACPRKLLTHGIVSHKRWKIEKRVAIVRHPFYRFLSLFHDYKRTGRITQDFTQRDFILAIREMDPKPGLFNSYQLSMCAQQVHWLLPGTEILDFEKTFFDMAPKLNSGNYTDMIDSDAVDLVRSYYAPDFSIFKHYE